MNTQIDFSANKKLVSIVMKAHEIIKRNAKGKDRAHYEADSDKISVDGIAAEVAAIMMFTPAQLFRAALRQWVETIDNGRNYGRDILATTIGLDKDLEIKCTEHDVNEATGILFMRVKGGDGIPKGAKRRDISYWIETLPDSYYLLFQKTGDFAFRFTCWSTREQMLSRYDRSSEFWENKLVEKKKGYPTICVHNTEVYKPASFFRKLTTTVV